MKSTWTKFFFFLKKSHFTHENIQAFEWRNLYVTLNDDFFLETFNKRAIVAKASGWCWGLCHVSNC